MRFSRRAARRRSLRLSSPHAHIVPFQVSDNPQYLLVGRPLIGQLGSTRVVVHVAVVEREMVEGHDPKNTVRSDWFCRLSNTAAVLESAAPAPNCTATRRRHPGFATPGGRSKEHLALLIAIVSLRCHNERASSAARTFRWLAGDGRGQAVHSGYPEKAGGGICQEAWGRAAQADLRCSVLRLGQMLRCGMRSLAGSGCPQ
jgi:hypothetical protein